VTFRLELHDSVLNEPAMFPAPENVFYNYQLELTGRYEMQPNVVGFTAEYTKFMVTYSNGY